ncbi:hypothetical protein D3C78_1375430 [compost metagenome]
MVGAGFGGRIGGAGRIGGGFGEQVLGAVQVAIHFIGRYMVEAEVFPGLRGESAPVAAGRFEQGVGPDYVGLDELGRSVDGTIDMRLGSQVHQCIRTKFGKYSLQRSGIADVGLVKAIALRVADAGQ